MSEKLPDIVAAMKWLDAFDSCVYSGPEWAAEHARTIKAEIERLRSPAPAEQHKDDWNIQGAVERENERTRLSAPAEDGLQEALESLSKMHLGDCPAAMDQLAHARAHIYEMRKLANNALSRGRDGGKP